MSWRTDNLTWRFELRLPDPDRWVPVTEEMVGGEWAEHAGTHEMVDIWQEAHEAAPDELDQALPELVGAGASVGMIGARIVVWEGIGTHGEPACVLEATADQVAAARLSWVNGQVQEALRQVEVARTRARVQIIKAAAEDRLSRNTIARLMGGALTRRLVLQLLAGWDLVEGIRDALPDSRRYRRWFSHPDRTDLHDPLNLEEEYLGPFCYGPVRLELAVSGQVYLGFFDVDGAEDDSEPDPELSDEEHEAAEREYRRERAERLQGYAAEVLPALTSAGFRLYKPDGQMATPRDVVDHSPGRPGLLVSDGCGS